VIVIIVIIIIGIVILRGPIGLFPEGLLDYSPRSYWIIPRGPIGLFPEVLIGLFPIIIIILL
jgi:hypothetical protein